MTSSQPELSADEVLAFLDRRATEQTRQAPAPEELQAFREAAAVLAAIADPDRLCPIGRVASPGDAPRILGSELIPAKGRKFHGRVMLAPDVRFATVKELAASDRIPEALEANPQEREGELQEKLERYLRGTAPALDEQSLAELDETHQVVVWLGGAIEGLPTAQEVSDRAVYLRLLAPFEAIAGDDTFRGRKRELDDLRSYIGVLAPASLLRRLRDVAFKWAEPKRQPALSISGPGGVGKSALVARFMLEHTRLQEEARVPFAYLDFDRADLDVGDPLGLCNEMIEQLYSQFSGGGSFEKLRSLVEESRRGVDPATEDQLGAARSMLADLLGVMRRVLGPRPYVVVLDTFEAVQYRGEGRAFPLWQMLNQLQEQAPFLRVVVSGRAPVISLRLAGNAPSQLALGQLDKGAAVAFLQAGGVRDSRFAEQLVEIFGGVPLSLKLAASLVARNATSDEPLLGNGNLLASVSTEVIQGQLYERILDHIGNDQVRRLAHPGLVLRRISPEIIMEVLNEPCDLGLTRPEEARELFEQLQRETSLVSVDDLDGSLVHRADLRRVMLKLLVANAPDRVERIRRAALQWYALQPGRRARAEEIYHRLHLGEWVGEEDVTDREVRGSIQSSMVEFPVEVQLRLATLGFQVSDETLRQGTLEQADASQAALFEEYLSYGESSEEEAARIVREGTKGLDRASPLFRSAARLAAQRGDDEGARGWIGRGLEHSVPEGRTRLTLALLQERAWLERSAAATERDDALSRLAESAEQHRDREALLQHRLQSFGTDPDSEGRQLLVVEELLGQATPEEVWALVPAFRPAIALALERHADRTIDRLRRLILEDESPFRYAAFPDPRPQRALEELLRGADTPDLRRFGESYVDLCRAWPYRVLSVSPPFGRRGEFLTESALA